MNDRELLELAAKAAGEDVEWHDTGSYFYRKSCNWPAEKGFFNPMHDDGEALRLAVKLNMMCDFGSHGCLVEAKEGKGPCTEVGNYRRAIVRAAAEIGKSL